MSNYSTYAKKSVKGKNKVHAVRVVGATATKSTFPVRHSRQPGSSTLPLVQTAEGETRPIAFLKCSNIEKETFFVKESAS